VNSTGGAASALEVRRLGRTRYADAHRLQQELVAARAEGRVVDALLATEHEDVVTLGRKSPPGDAAGVDMPVVAVERGGEATWHGPGQVVLYPIVLLPEGRRDLHAWLRGLEQVVIDAMADFGVEGRRVEGYTGVWIGDRKACSIGVAVRRWTTWHGLALNVRADLARFAGFNPCGLDPRLMANLGDHAACGLPEVEDRLVARFVEFHRGWTGSQVRPPSAPESGRGAS
jgi:lipoyl(octanoyl) transferase